MQMTLFFLSLPEFHCCYHRDVSERNEQFLLRKITRQTVRWWIMASDRQEHLSAGYLMEFWWSRWPNGAWERWKISWIIFLTACYISCKQQPWFVRNCVETIKYPFLGSIFFFFFFYDLKKLFTEGRGGERGLGVTSWNPRDQQEAAQESKKMYIALNVLLTCCETRHLKLQQRRGRRGHWETPTCKCITNHCRGKKKNAVI